MASWHRLDPERCNFQLLILALTLVSLLERESRLEIATPRGDIRKYLQDGQYIYEVHSP
jgi:hypothetical protein